MGLSKKVHIAVLVLLTAFPFFAYGQKPLDGTWELIQAVGGPGVQSADSLRKAAENIGINIEFKGKDVTFSTGEKCIITAAEKIILDDFDPEFGNFGARWHNMGLIASERDQHLYDVTAILIDCENNVYRDIIVANNGALYLMSFDGQYLEMQKP